MENIKKHVTHQILTQLAKPLIHFNTILRINVLKTNWKSQINDYDVNVFQKVIIKKTFVKVLKM